MVGTGVLWRKRPYSLVGLRRFLVASGKVMVKVD